MTPAQTSLYFREWGLVRRYYAGHGLDPKQADNKRHELHRRALGTDKSSKDFDNRDLDKVLGAFRAVHDGGNLNAQLAQDDQPAQRLADLHRRIEELAERCGIERGRDGVAAYFTKFLRGRRYDQLTERDLQKVAGVLYRRAKQLAGNPF